MRISEELLCKLPEKWNEESWTVSPDCRHVAFGAEIEKKRLWMKGDSKWAVVRDGKTGPEYDQLELSVGVHFSPDSKHLAYAGWRGGKVYVRLDDAESDAFAELQQAPLVFSPNSFRLAYVARRGDLFAVVNDGVDGRPYSKIARGSVTFSPDSQRVAYAALRGAEWVMVDGGIEGRPFLTGTACPVYSPDSQRLAYVAQSGNEFFVVVDEKPYGPYEGVAFPEGIRFSADSRVLAFVALKDRLWRAVVDGVEHAAYESVGDLFFAFSPVGEMLGYDVLFHTGRRAVWIDGKMGNEYYDIAPLPLVFSPNGQHYVYAVGGGVSTSLVIDGVDQPPYDKIGTHSVRYSNNGERFGHSGSRYGKHMIVVDGAEGPTYDYVDEDGWSFSPDHRHFAYLASNELKMGNQHMVSVDHQTLEVKCDDFLGSLVWDDLDAQVLHTMIRRKQEIMRIKVSLHD
jgi:hypothetical protein